MKGSIKELVELGLTAIKAGQGAVLLATEDGKALRFALVVSRGGLEKHGQLFEDLVGREVPIGKGVTGLAALERRPHCAIGGESKEGFFRVEEDASPAAVLAVPMLLGEELVGVMTAISFDGDRFFPQESQDLYCRYAKVVASMVCNMKGI